MTAEVNMLKRHTKESGSIECFPDILHGVNSMENMYAWVKAKFGQDRGGDQPGNDNDSVWAEMKDSGGNTATFAPFCDIYVLCAIAEDLDSVYSKGDTLKEMDYIVKSGINHPGKAVVVYSLKRSIPGIFGDGTSLYATFHPTRKLGASFGRHSKRQVWSSQLAD